MSPAPACLQVAVFAPVRQTFDYLPPSQVYDTPAAPGCRVKVPFGNRTPFGVITGIGRATAAPGIKLKPVLALVDEEPVVCAELLALSRWAADYYQHPLGDILCSLLPTELRRGLPMRTLLTPQWVLTSVGRAAIEHAGIRGARQAELLAIAAAGPIGPAALAALPFDSRRVLRDALAKGWLQRRDAAAVPPFIATEAFLALNDAQQAATRAILAARERYAGILLHGITGSGKTEVYLHAIREIIAADRQTLVLVPEIALTEQLVQRFRARFGAAVGVIHSGLSERTRALAWLRCRQGDIKILLGTRSAVWMPLPALSLIVIDEEHDPSYKQQEGFRYSARDVAVMRARRANIPVVLGSATPSLESYLNADRGKYLCLRLPARAGAARPPEIRGLDVRGLPLQGGLSDALIRAIRACLLRGEQALLFLNRRGYAPLALCHVCGWLATCERCDARLVLHKHRQRLVCHHCGAERPLAADFPGHACGASGDFVPIGLGTEQVEEALAALFPGRRVVRIDRDTMRSKDRLARTFEAIRDREIDILIGTQMIAKGHDFSGVTLVGIVDADSRLFAADFRAEERFVQLVLQVAGRAGRVEAPGLVLIQTHHPEHPIFAKLIGGGYDAFARAALAERAAAELPPYSALAVLRAEATDRAQPNRFLTAAAAALRAAASDGLTIAGPIAAPMEKKAGKYRANLLLTADTRPPLAHGIRVLLDRIDRLPGRSRVRWHLDIDPQDLI